jgi:site-specific recombinase XerD
MLQEIDLFIDWVRMRSPEAKTWRDYKSDLALFLSVVADRNPTEILPKDVDQFVNYQIDKGFKPSTVNRRLAAVSSFYRYLIQKGRAETCPVLPKRHYLREPQRLPRPVNEWDLRKFFGAINGVRDLAMFTLMLRCGLRIGEVAGLKMEDVYLGESPSRLIIHGKGSRERTVYLSQSTEQALQYWLSQRPSARDKHLFLSYQHKQLSTNSISVRVKCVCRMSGVDLTAHRLRHSFADHLLTAGMPITSIQKLMGHRFVETTQNYAMANDRDVQADFYKACEKLEGWKLLFQNVEPLDSDKKENEDINKSSDECDQDGIDQVQITIPSPISLLPVELARQLEAYRQLKASRWRLERKAANSTTFYSLHGRMWRFFSEQCCLKSVSELELDHVLQYIKARLEDGRSARTINAALSSLRSFLSFLKEDAVSIHPSLNHLQRLQEAERLPRYLTYEQVLRLKTVMEQKGHSPEKQQDAKLLRAVFYLLWQGGLRSGEVELLRFGDVYISQANQVNRLFIRDGKWRKGRVVYLTDVALAALKEYLAVRGVVHVTDFVFVRNGLPLKKNFLSQQIKRMGRQVALEVSAHRLRHTFATQLLNVGCKVTSIQKLLGHTNLSTTLAYARAFDKTVMQDYFLALDTLETKPDGAWFELHEIQISGEQPKSYENDFKV